MQRWVAMLYEHESPTTLHNFYKFSFLFAPAVYTPTTI